MLSYLTFILFHILDVSLLIADCFVFVLGRLRRNQPGNTDILMSITVSNFFLKHCVTHLHSISCSSYLLLLLRPGGGRKSWIVRAGVCT